MSEAFTIYGIGPDKQADDLAALRDENARLREALVECRRELWHCNHQLKAKGSHEGFSVTEALRKAQVALQSERGDSQ